MMNMDLKPSIVDIQIIGSIDPDQSIDIKKIREVFSYREQTLMHGAAFTGRPATKIIADDHYVIKCRSEYRFDEYNSKRWINQALEKERQYHIHHPAKTWFYIREVEQVIIASITPKLLPLHVRCKVVAPDKFIGSLASMADMYFQAAADFSIKLDEGLSNYGMDEEGRLYYLDDDIYPLDKFVSLTHALGVWFRQFEWLDPGQAHELGIIFREALLKYFTDTHWVTVISEQLNRLFYANEDQLNRKKYFLDGFKKVGSVAQRKPLKIKGKQFAVLADIHANYPALKTVLEKLDDLGIEEAIVLGDTIGYGPHPVECIRELQKRNFLTIRGNHDHALVTGIPARGFSSTGRWVLEWSTTILGKSEYEWLVDLPSCHQQDGWFAVHGAPQDKTFFNAYVYQLTYEENLSYLVENAIPVCLYGHTHIQGVYYSGCQGIETLNELRLDETSHYLVCPGSVGQPRNKKIGAEFAIFDQERRNIQFYRVDYDLERTIKDMYRYEFPPQLINRLRKGQ